MKYFSLLLVERSRMVDAIGEGNSMILEGNLPDRDEPELQNFSSLTDLS